jgi:uncharacterized damage-inducible protein DinB
MKSELEDLTEHLERFRAVTLSLLDALDDDDLNWRPTPGQYSLGQQLLHIAQAEDLYAHGLFESDWNYERVRFPASLPSCAALREFFLAVRRRTLQHLERLGGDTPLGRVVEIPGSPLEHTLRSWLWFLVEHEMHHKAQAAVYLRLMGRTPPFYAMPLAPGERPDVKAREDLGGF